MTCTTPLAFETLVDLWAGSLSAADADAAEAHLFACDRCAEASEKLGALVVALSAHVPPVISHARRDALIAAGTRIHVTPVEPGTPAHARFSPGLDLLVHVLRADVAGADRVDVDILDEHGHLRIELPLVPFDARTGEVLIACQRHFEHLFPGDPQFRVHAVRAGARRDVGTFVVVHEWL